MVDTWPKQVCSVGPRARPWKATANAAGPERPTGTLPHVMGMTGFERRLERLVEGAFARAFRSQLRPVELGRRVVREMDARLQLGVRGERVAPNHLIVSLSDADHERMSALGETLVADLEDAVNELANSENYVLKGPATIELRVDPRHRVGQFGIEATVKPGLRPERAKAWLVLHDGRRVALREGEPVTIGRLPECDIPVLDPNVSRRHAEVRLERDIAVVVDLESLNGTKVNGRGVSKPHGRELAEGDEIQIGATTITLVLES